MITEIYLYNLNYESNKSVVLLSSDNQHWLIVEKFILQFYISIASSESCPECRIKTLRSIQTQSIPFNILQQDGSCMTVSIQEPFVRIISDLENKTTTIQGDLVFVFRALNKILREKRNIEGLTVLFSSHLFC